MKQTQAILGYLQMGYSISPLEALNKFGCFRLGARIFDIKKMGYNIKSKLVKDPLTGKHYSRYTLVGKEKQQELFERVA